VNDLQFLTVATPAKLFSGEQLCRNHQRGAFLPLYCRLKFDLSVESLPSSFYSLLQVTHGHHISIDNLITFMNEEPEVSDVYFMYTYSTKEN
jgi:hypothetical protein